MAILCKNAIGYFLHEKTGLTAMAAILMWILSVLLVARSSLSSYLTSTQQQALLDLKVMFENPPELNMWNTYTNICDLPPNPAVTVECENGFLTHLQIMGSRASPSSSAANSYGGMLSRNFSSEALMLQLSSFTNLKVLHLTSLGLWGPLSSKLNRLTSLQFLNLSSNYFSGGLPNCLTLLKDLQVLAVDNNLLNASLPQHWDGLTSLALVSLSNNRIVGTMPTSIFTLPNLRTLVLDNNLLNGEIPASISAAYGLQALSLSNNHITGNIPNMLGLTGLVAFNIQSNNIGPNFPLFSSQIVYLAMGKNNFQGPIPTSVGAFTQMQQLDLSSNVFSGPSPDSLFTLPSMKYLDVSRNHLSGSLPANITLPSSLKALDLSHNLLTGYVPAAMLACLVDASSNCNVSIEIEGNCLSTTVQSQNPFSTCEHAALALGVNAVHTSRSTSHSSGRKNKFLLSGISGGVIGIGLACVILLVLIVTRIRSRHFPFSSRSKLTKGPCTGDKSDILVSSELLSNARYISQTLRLGILGSAFREFSMEELCKATAYFHDPSFLGEGSSGKAFKGQLEDGSLVAIKKLNKDKVKGLGNFKTRLELLGRCRHQHLVSLLGYNITDDEGAQAPPQLCLVYEYISNQTLRTRLAGKAQDGFGWLQRLLILIGIAKGIHFLHYGVLPSIVDNQIKTSNILLDQNLVPKVSNYGLAHTGSDNDCVKLRHKGSTAVEKHRKKLADKHDVYNYGLVLLEVLIGKAPTMDDKGGWKELGCIQSEQGPRIEALDPRIVSGCNLDSLTTVVDMTENCLSPNLLARPSMEDVLWNLQYALQVQGSTSNGGSSQDDVLDGRYCAEPMSNKSSTDQGKSTRRHSFQISKVSSEELGKPPSPISDFFR